MYDIPLMRPHLPPATRQKVLEVLDSGYLTEGPATRAFEGRVRDWLGAAHVLAVTSCTTGLEMALRALGIGPGDEVVVPDYTYPASASAVAILGATPVLVDVDPGTMLVDYTAMARAVTSRTKALLPVSLFGNPLDQEALDAISQAHGLPVVEDAACALGASWRGRPVGTMADISVFSLHPRKFVTTGEGGLVCTEDDRLAGWMERFKHFGMAPAASREGVVFETIGTNLKLSNVQAAIGLAQMDLVDEMLARRRTLAVGYLERLADVAGVGLPRVTAGGEHSWQTFCVRVPNRDAVMNRMRQAGVEVQIGTYALHLQPAFRDNPGVRIVGDMAGSRLAFDQALALPLYHELTEAQMDRVVETLLAALAREAS